MTQVWKRYCLAALCLCAPALMAQEPWDSSFKLVAGNFSGAESALIGQNRNYALAMEGAYPLSRRGSVAFDLGFRVFPTTTVHPSTHAYLDYKTDGFYASALYRHQLWLDGIYVQGGLRASRYKDALDSISNDDGSRVTLKGSPEFSVKPILGLGYRFTAKLSLEANAAPLSVQNVAGQTKSGTLVEVALGIHL